ncbi:MAG: tRNA (guanosine(46)-N7)-methyltransferase TrmB [Bacteroidales bacterium]|jgi:tRNA (guanine-N7-)-methyltransferase|nr:tRNA (guanosine(46)-N7)-methyltransferase TrmB [Bacteroidales bacterium]MBR5831115.1 tRNA (guanosine(46)-N7)-methyltransferase TrmB [Bacteroidales bacterium]
MGKNKLERFEENLTFPNLFQVSYEFLQQNTFHLRGKWNTDFFKNDNPIVLELGCGKGEYTVNLAKKYPNKNFIGIDIKGARLWRGCKTSNEDKMTNVAFLRTRIQLIEQFFAQNEVSEIWITFPDPQLKKPNKRLTCERFLSYYKNIAKTNTVIHLKTDSYELYDYTLNEVIPQGNYKVLFNTDDLYSSDFQDDVKSVRTFYEQMFLNEGKKITYLQFLLN